MTKPPDSEVDWPTDEPEPDPDALTPPHGIRPLPRPQPQEAAGQSGDPGGRPGDLGGRPGGWSGAPAGEQPSGWTAERAAAWAGGGAKGARGNVDGDRLWVHFVWEAILLVGVVAAAITLSVLGSSVFSGRSLDSLLVQAASIGLIATGLACSMRAAVPNLAVGAVGACAAAVLGRMLDEDVSFTLAALVVLTGAVLVGLVIAVVVVGLHVPAWAATLGTGLLVVALATAVDGRNGRPIREAGLVTDVPWLWFAVFVLISVGGGAACMAPAVRRWLGGVRGDRDPARRPGGAAAVAAGLALTISTVLAAAGGMVYAAGLGFAEPAGPVGFIFFALAAVLLGGVSAFGRRGGVAGTVLGVLLVIMVIRIAQHQGAGVEVRDAVLGAAIVLGLVVNRILEATGRRTA